MDYPNKTVTDAGADLMAQCADKDNSDKMIIDNVIISDKLSPSSTPLEQTTLDEFANPKTVAIDTVKHQDNTFQPEVTLHNTGLTEDYPIYMIGLLAHDSNSDDDTEILYAVAEAGDDPMILPHQTDTPFDFTIALPVGIGPSDNVKIITTEAGAATIENLKDYEPLDLANEAHNKLSSQIQTMQNDIGNDLHGQLASLKATIKILEGNVPATPTIAATLVVNNNKGTVQYTITQPAQNDTRDVSIWHVYYKSSEENTFKEIDNETTTGAIDNVDPTKSYEMYVIAENMAGQSNKSIEITTGKVTVPSAPQISAMINGNTSIMQYTITAPNDDGGANITNYQIFYKEDEDSNYKEVDDKNLNLVGTISGIDPKAHYEICATAVNIAGASQRSATVEATTPTVAPQPGLNVTFDHANSCFNYSITAPSNDGGAPITAYVLSYKNHANSNWDGSLTLTDNLTGSLPFASIQNYTPNVPYDFSVYAVNFEGNSPANSGTVDQVDGRIFGVTSNDIYNPQLQRTDAAQGLQAGINGAQNDFDNVSVWEGIHRYTDSLGNVMVWIPKFYIHKEMSGSSLTIKISLVKIDDSYYLPKCFWDFQNNCELDHVSVGAYDASDNGNGGLASQSGATPLVNADIDDFRTRARNLGAGYQQLDVHIYDAIMWLFVVEFATLNSQSVMRGDVDDNVENNGATDGGAGSSHTSSNNTMCYRGIENLYGNVSEWIDGISENTSNASAVTYWVCDDANNYQSNVFANPYQQVGGQDSQYQSGWVSQLGFDSNNPEVNLPTQFNGSSTSYFCDYGSVGLYGCSGFCIASVWNDGDDAGLFCRYDTSSAARTSSLGGRLAYKP